MKKNISKPNQQTIPLTEVLKKEHPTTTNAFATVKTKPLLI